MNPISDNIIGVSGSARNAVYARRQQEKVVAGSLAGNGF